jgi:hypothetical protein
VWLRHQVAQLEEAGFRVERRVIAGEGLDLLITDGTAHSYRASLGYRFAVGGLLQMQMLDAHGACIRVTYGARDAASGIQQLKDGAGFSGVTPLCVTLLMPDAWCATPLRGAGRLEFAVARRGSLLALGLTGTRAAARLHAASLPFSGPFGHRHRGWWTSVDPQPRLALLPVGERIALIERALAVARGRSLAQIRRTLRESAGAVIQADGGAARWFASGRDAHGAAYEIRPELLVEREFGGRAPFASDLDQKRVTLVGCGAVGWSVALLLARAGVRHFALYDPDDVGTPNLSRLGAHLEDVGASKVVVLAAYLKSVAPGVEVAGSHDLVGFHAGPGALTATSPDLILDLCAEGAASDVVNLAALGRPCPAIFGWVSNGVRGARLFRLRPGASACYECVRESEPTPIESDGRIRGTWQGAMHDAELFAAAVARMAVRTLLGEAASAENPDHVVLRYGGVVPTATTLEIPRRRSCDRCGSGS